ncbi:unnamed protein product [Merluccius merluccius]
MVMLVFIFWCCQGGRRLPACTAPRVRPQSAATATCGLGGELQLRLHCLLLVVPYAAAVSGDPEDELPLTVGGLFE